MSALYPDVPYALGVPNVLRDAINSVVDPVTALTADSASLPTASAPVWGIYDNAGGLAIYPDSFNAIETQKEEAISTFPVEQGGFQSYNKVETPYRLRVILTKGGSIDERSAFLSACNDLRSTTDLYSVITPEEVYDNGNVTRVGQVRNAQQGAQLLTVELIVEEIRQSATVAYTPAPQSPSNAAQVNDGSVQAKTTGDVEVVSIGGHKLPAGGM